MKINCSPSAMLVMYFYGLHRNHWGDEVLKNIFTPCVYWCGLVLSPESQEPASACSCVTTVWCDLGIGCKLTVQGFHLLD